MQKLSLQDQLKRIQYIMNHPAWTTCLDCGQKYIPMDQITIHLCPYCKHDEIEALKSDEEMEKEIEIVSHEESEI